MKDGWYDGRGLAPTAEGLDWLSWAFNEHYPDNVGLPSVYPVAEGGVRLEWSIGPRDISLEIDLQTRAGAWHALDLATDDEDVQLLNLNSKADWDWMVQRLLTQNGSSS